MASKPILNDIIEVYDKNDHGQAMYTKHIKKSTINNLSTTYIAGIDEAGRGPVLGPMVYCIFYCEANFQNQLKNIKCDDSKSMSDNKRRIIFDWICDHENECGFILEMISPNVISTSMLSWVKYDLNTLSHDTVAKLIDCGANSTKNNIENIFIDTVGQENTYHSYLMSRIKNKNIKLTVSKKADSKFVVVSAASICAKVVRDTIIEQLTKKYNHTNLTSNSQIIDIGSGYPSDPKTISWIASIKNVFDGFPSFLVRYSWKTIQNVLEEKLSIKWPSNTNEAHKKNKKSNKSVPSLLNTSQLLCQFQLHTSFDPNKL